MNQRSLHLFLNQIIKKRELYLRLGFRIRMLFSEVWASDGDLDGDGIADDVEGMADLDGDGIEDFRDFDTPTMWVTQPTFSSGSTFELQVDGRSGQTYLFQRTVDLAQPDWITVQTAGPLGINQTLLLIDETPPEQAAFYRVLRIGN